MAGETIGEKVARLDEWHENHETRCDERQGAMGREIKEMKVNLSALTKGAWGIALALLAFTAAQLYDGLKVDTRQVTSVSVSQAPPAKAP